MSELSTIDIKFLPGVGSKRAELLTQELDIRSFEDLLYYFPYKYIDRSKIYTISEINASTQYIQLKGRIISYGKAGVGKSARLIAKFVDKTGEIELIWFKGQKYIADQYKIGNEYIVFGKPSIFGSKINIVHPEIDTLGSVTGKLVGGLFPFYNTTEKMKNNFLNSKAIQKLMVTLFEKVNFPVPETLPAYLLQQYNLMNLTDSLNNIHFPKNDQLLEKARHRMKFEELFYIQLGILRQMVIRKQKLKGFVFSRIGDYFNTFYKEHIPFELTNAQKKVIKEIRKDLNSGIQMNRLLQGDVGSGKTLVALMCMLIALDNGYQTCIMAPTEILANQHYETLSEQIKPLGIKIALLTGSVKKSARTPILEELKSGEIQILIGTHALIEDTVQFSNLGLVIIDEQHRFGVAQRAKLWKKNAQPPHVLVMTATPIPRTLAMTVYGDLDVSIIDELPPGRKPIQTKHCFEGKRPAILEFIKKQIQFGRQVYVVYPLIQESEKMDFKNLEDGFEQLKKDFPDFTIGMVHGKMKQQEKDDEMNRFVSGETQILVATTVIEVGVNVPNASVMIIESAERFGLSQLHQLRGRVGRGSDQSYCMLVSSPKLGQDSKRRMEIMTGTTDGFEIAEADMQLRGFGDMEGLQQSGDAFKLRIANISRDSQLLQYTRNIVENILAEDPELKEDKNRVLVERSVKLSRGKIGWGLIS